MQRKHLALLAIVVSLSLFNTVSAADAEALQGTWLPAVAELGGKPFPDEIRKNIKLVITGEKYHATVGQTVDQGSFKLDPAATPKKMEIVSTDGPNKGKSFPAIYDLQGDTLRVCYDLSGKGYPTEFKSTEGTFLYLVTYKRAKP